MNKTCDQILDELAALPVLHPSVQRQALVAKLREVVTPQPRPALDEETDTMWRVLISAGLANALAAGWSLPMDAVNVNHRTMILNKYHEVSIGDCVVPYTWDDASKSWQYDKDAVTSARCRFAAKALQLCNAWRSSVRWGGAMTVGLLAIIVATLISLGTWAVAFAMALFFAPLYTILVQQMIESWRKSKVAWREHANASAAIDRDTAAELSGISTVVV